MKGNGKTKGAKRETSMAIEIRELVIKAVVTDAASDNERLQRALARMKQEILDACRESVQQMVHRGKDR